MTTPEAPAFLSAYEIKPSLTQTLTNVLSQTAVADAMLRAVAEEVGLPFEQYQLEGHYRLVRREG